MQYRFYTADVFTNQRFGGNQLAVFPDATGLSPELMAQIAREFNLSETVFVFPPDDPAHTRRLRIFTPGMELPFAGHPTIGAAYVLAATGAIPTQAAETRIIFEEGVGPVPVSIFGAAGQPKSAILTAAQLPEFGPPAPDTDALAALLSLEAAELLTGAYAPQAVSCGVPFLFVPVRDRVTLARVRLNREQWASLLAGWWAPHVYVLTFDPGRPDCDLRARMFAPAMNIVEDPATGAAAAALAGYLGSRETETTGTFRWLVEQGIEMGRPSLLEVAADKVDGTFTAVRVGGASVLVSEGYMDVGTG